MALVVLLVLVALGVSALRGGGLRQLGALRLSAPGLAVAALTV